MVQLFYYENRGKCCKNLWKHDGSQLKVFLHAEESWAETSSASYWLIKSGPWWSNLTRKVQGKPQQLVVKEYMGTKCHVGHADLIDNGQQGVIWIRGSFKRRNNRTLEISRPFFKLTLSSHVTPEDFQLGYSMTGTVERSDSKYVSFQTTHLAFVKRKPQQQQHQKHPPHLHQPEPLKPTWRPDNRPQCPVILPQDFSLMSDTASSGSSASTFVDDHIPTSDPKHLQPAQPAPDPLAPAEHQAHASGPDSLLVVVQTSTPVWPPQGGQGLLAGSRGPRHKFGCPVQCMDHQSLAGLKSTCFKTDEEASSDEADPPSIIRVMASGSKGDPSPFPALPCLDGPVPTGPNLIEHTLLPLPRHGVNGSSATAAILKRMCRNLSRSSNS